MDLLKDLATRLALRYLESAVTKDSVDEKLAEAHTALKAYVAKTPSKVDDKVLEVVEKVVVGEVAKALTAMVVKFAKSVAARTETKVDDQVVAIVEKAVS